MNLILVLVFFLSLMFLAMIFGERLSLFGLVDGRWVTAPYDMLVRLRDMTGELLDRMWCFLFDHFWWVTATLSGGAGVAIVAMIMVSGLTREAAAVRTDERAVMRVGSVLDHTPVLDPDNVLMANTSVAKADDSQLIYQVPSGFSFPLPSSNQRPVVIDRTPLPRIMDLPPPPVRYRDAPPAFQSTRLTLTMEPIDDALELIELAGRPAERRDMDRLIQRAMLALRSDDWRVYSDMQARRRGRPSRAALPEDTEFSVRDLTSRVRVIPGDAVSASQLQVEKFAPADTGPGEFEIQIRVTNPGTERLNGIIVRELLPVAWAPKMMEPRGTFRDATVTWLLPELRPLEEQILTLQVESTESGRFQSLTEVSAAAAVSNMARVTRKAQPLPPVPTPVEPQAAPRVPRRAQPPLRLPDVRLTLEQPPAVAEVDEWVTVYFQVENIGDAPAIGVSLRVTLPAGLDHHTLEDSDTNRRVDSNVRLLEVGEKRRMTLKVRPSVRGMHFTTAELVLQDSQLDVQYFEIEARQPVQRQPLPKPEPDFSIRGR